MSLLCRRALLPARLSRLLTPRQATIRIERQCASSDRTPPHGGPGCALPRRRARTRRSGCWRPATSGSCRLCTGSVLAPKRSRMLTAAGLGVGGAAPAGGCGRTGLSRRSHGRADMPARRTKRRARNIPAGDAMDALGAPEPPGCYVPRSRDLSGVFAPHTAMTIFPWVCPSPWWRSASGTSLNS
jgi:hypothetical protein